VLKISKQIPARTIKAHTEEYLWCKKDFLLFDREFLQIRSRIGDNGPHRCHWCEHNFVIGEIMALAQPKKGKNKLLCQDCADELLQNAMK